MRRSARGYTLAELLLVVALLAFAFIAASTALLHWFRIDVATKAGIESSARATAALERFSADVRSSREVLRLTPDLVALRLDAPGIDDPGQTGEPPSPTVVEWRWAGPGSPWTREGPDGSEAFAPLVSLDVGGETAPPSTRHVVVFAAYASEAETHTIGTSAAVRADPLDR